MKIKKSTETLKSTKKVNNSENVRRMGNKKTIGIIFLLIVLTMAVVLAPQLISEGRKAKRIDEVTYRDYKASERAQVTGDEVARLYYDRQIDTESNLRIIDGKTDDAELVREEILSQMDLLVGKGPELSEPLVARIAESDMSGYRGSCLILVDNHPMALNFVDCCIKENDLVFEITYEEKTKTLLGFAVDASAVQFRSTEEKEQYSTKVVPQIQAFFEDGLNLGPNEYYCFVETSEEAGTGDPAHVVIRCGILHEDEKEAEKY